MLVTGADGFIGSHLVERLMDGAASVIAFCVYNSNGSCGCLDELGAEWLNDLDLQLGNIRDTRRVRREVTNVDVVFHLVALVEIPYNYQAPESFVDTNITGTLNVLEAVRDAGHVRMVNTTTSEVCGTPQSVPIRESRPLCGQSPSSASKIAADQLCEAYARSFDLDVLSEVDAEVITDAKRVRPEASEDQLLLSEPTRSKEALGWEPTWELDDGLRETSRWLAPRVEVQRAARYHR